MNKEENKSIEYKSVFEEDIKHEILGFLNTSGGIIYVGINDDKTINKEFLNVNRKEIELQLSNWIETIISPSVFGLVSHTFTENGVLVINVQEGHKKPYYLKGKGPKPVGVYKRIGSTTRKASEEEIMMMLLDSRNYVFEKETSENQKLTFKYLSSVFKEKNISFTKRNQISLGLVDNNGFYTNLALLSDQSEITVKLAEYDYKMNFKIKREFKGCLIKIFKDVEEQVERLNDTAAIIDGKTFERKERKSYPEVSLREIILNAFCHTNYMIKSNIKIEFFQSYVKITSPGGLYLASMEEIMSGIQTYRNPKLVRILDKLKFIENYGTGILRVKQEYKNYFIKPEFYNMGNFFVVKLPNINYKNKIDQIKSGDQINILRKSILLIIKKHPGIKVNEILEQLVCMNIYTSITTIQNQLKRKLSKYVVYIGSRKTGGYYFKQDIK